MFTLQERVVLLCKSNTFLFSCLVLWVVNVAEVIKY